MSVIIVVVVVLVCLSQDERNVTNTQNAQELNVFIALINGER